MVIERGADASVLPESVQGIIAARLDGLPAEEKSLLQDAAVVGRTSWLGAVCALGERERGAAEEVAFRLERKQLLLRTRQSSVAGEIELSFAHDLIQDVAYAQLTRPQRAERHEHAAEWIEQLAGDRDDRAELVAHHLGTALDLRDALGEDTAAQRERRSGRCPGRAPGRCTTRSDRDDRARRESARVRPGRRHTRRTARTPRRCQ